MGKSLTLCIIALVALASVSHAGNTRSIKPPQKKPILPPPVNNYKIFKGTPQQFDDTILKGTHVGIFANPTDVEFLSAFKGLAQSRSSVNFHELALGDYVELMPFYSALSSTAAIVFRDGDVIGELVPPTPVTPQAVFALVNSILNK